MVHAVCFSRTYHVMSGKVTQSYPSLVYIILVCTCVQKFRQITSMYKKDH